MDYGQHQSERLMRLAAFAAELEVAAVPPAIVEKAKSCLLYGLAVGMAARRAKQSAIAAQLIPGPGEGVATRLLDGARTSVEDAAFANATLFHSRCQEDAHPAGHIGTVVLPAALALGEAVGASGEELLSAIIAGYEVALRIGRDHVADLSARGFRSTGAYGVFGAAAAAARLLGLDGEPTAHALALAANMAGGLRVFVQAGSEDFPYHAGFAAKSGLLAANLAASGGKGPLEVLEAPGGFFAAFGKAGGEYGARMESGLGREFELENVTFKPYPTCQFHRAIVSGLISLRVKAGGEDATAIEIRMNPAEADFWGVRFAGPFRSFPQAFMSAPYCAAVAWTRGDVRFSDLDRFGVDAVETLAARVTVVSDPERRRYQPSLKVTLTDGRSLTFAGDPELYLLEWESAVAMTRRLGAEIGTAVARQDALIRAVAMMEGSAGLTELIAAVQSCMSGDDGNSLALSHVGAAMR